MTLLTTTQYPPFDANNITGPIRALAGIVRSENITPGSPYGETARWIYVGTSGDVSLLKPDGTTQVYKNMPVGFYPIASIQVNTSGTTAANLVWAS